MWLWWRPGYFGGGEVSLRIWRRRDNGCVAVVAMVDGCEIINLLVDVITMHYLRTVESTNRNHEDYILQEKHYVMKLRKLLSMSFHL